MDNNKVVKQGKPAKVRAFRTVEHAEKFLKKSGWDGMAPVAFYYRPGKYVFAGYAGLCDFAAYAQQEVR